MAIAQSRRLTRVRPLHERPDPNAEMAIARIAAKLLGERFFGIHEHLHDALLRGFRLRRGLVRHRPPEAQGGSLAVTGDLDVVEAGGGVMLDGHEDLPVAAAPRRAVHPGDAGQAH